MITGTRTRLRAMEHSDLANFVRWLNDEEVTEGLLLSLPLSMAQEEAWFEKMLQRPPEEQVLVIEARAPEGWLPVGSTSFNEFDWRSRIAEFGIVIGEKKVWGQGHGQDAVRLMLRHGFNTLNLNRIFLQVFETNQRAIHSYERTGFVLEGRLRQDMFKNGKYLDVLIMSVLRSEWQDVEV